jgi:Fe-S-cluster-containing hydrogenase component 2
MSHWWLQLFRDEMNRRVGEAMKVMVKNRPEDEAVTLMTLDELIAMTEAGPAVVMMGKDDALELMQRLRLAELQVEAARKQAAYQSTRAAREKEALAAIRARLDELQTK